MKKILVLLAVVLAVASCGKKQKNEIKWKLIDVVPTVPVRADDNISLRYPYAEGGEAAVNINNTVRAVMAKLLDHPGSEIGSAVDSILIERDRDTMIRHIPYSIMGDAETGSYGNVVSVLLNTYQYLGGAHGISVAYGMNFDANTGELLSVDEMFTDTLALQKINRKMFFEEHKNDPGRLEWLFVDPDELPLPQTMAIDSAGLFIYYNTYEIAPHSAGPTEYVIPIAEIDNILNKKVFE